MDGERCEPSLQDAKPENAITRHCHGTLKRGVIDKLGRNQEANFIPEPDLYRLIAISKHCRGVVKHHITDKLGRNQEANFIPEPDLYRLIAISKHCRGTVKHRITDSLGRNQEANFIPEPDLYRLISSKKSTAVFFDGSEYTYSTEYARLLMTEY